LISQKHLELLAEPKGIEMYRATSPRVAVAILAAVTLWWIASPHCEGAIDHAVNHMVEINGGPRIVVSNPHTQEPPL